MKEPAAPRGARPPRHRLSVGLQLYMCREVLKSFILIFCAFQVVIGSIFSIGAVRDYGVDVGLILPLLVPALAANMNAAVPVSLLFATVLVLGRLIADREVAAMKSFGFSYVELALLPAALGTVIGLAALVLNLYVIPDLRFTRDNLGGIILERLRYLGEGRDRTLPLRDGYTLWIEHYKGSKLKGIFIGAEKASIMGVRGVRREGSPGGIRSRTYPVFLYAAEGEVMSDPGAEGKAPYIQLRGASAFVDREYLDPEITTDFKDRWDFGKLKLQVVPDESKLNDRERNLPALRRQIARTRVLAEEAHRKGDTEMAKGAADQHFAAVTELHRRFTFAIVALTFPLAGACLALFLNSPNRLLPVFVSLMVVPAVFYVLEMRGNSLARGGCLPWFWEELGNVGLLVLAAALFWILRRRTLW